jgi:acetylglutamate kinase
VPGVLRDVTDPASRIPRLSVADGKKAIADGIVTKGMIPKLEESFAAIAEGVKAVHVVGRLERGQLAREVAAPGSVGTVLVA